MKKIEIKHDYWFGAFVLAVFLLILLYNLLFGFRMLPTSFIMIFEVIKDIIFLRIDIGILIFAVMILSIYWGLFYFTVWKLYIGLNYYNSTEMCYIEDNNFIYKRICYFWGIYTYTFEKKLFLS